MLGELKADLLVWISSLLDHWVALATGGAVTAALAVLRDRYPNLFQWSRTSKIWFAFLLFSVFQSWQVEYKSRTARERDLIASNHQIDSLNQELHYQQQRLTERCDQQLSILRQDTALKEGVSQTLQKQNRDQQGTINGYITQTFKLLQQPELKITKVYAPPQVWDSKTARVASKLLITNREISPLAMKVTCRSPVTFGWWLTSPSRTLGASGNIGVSDTFNRVHFIRLQSPSWLPNTPIGVGIGYNEPVEPVCDFELE